MRTAPSDHRRPTGLDYALPAVVSVERDSRALLVALTAYDPETVIPPLVTRWLAREFGASFLPAADDERSLADDVFYDKLAAAMGGAFVAILVLAAGNDPRDRVMPRRMPVRWLFRGNVTAHANLAHRSVLVEWEGLPGALSLNCGPVRGGHKPCALRARYGFGRALAPSYAILDALKARKPARRKRGLALDG